MRKDKFILIYRDRLYFRSLDVLIALAIIV